MDIIWRETHIKKPSLRKHLWHVLFPVHQKGSNLKRKELAPQGTNYFIFELIPAEKRVKIIFD